MRNKITWLALALLMTGSLFLQGCCGTDKQPPVDQEIDLKASPSSEDKSASPYSDTVLQLGRIPFTNATQMVHQHNKFLEHLTKTLGVRQTRLQTALDYSSIMSLLEKGDIDIGWLGTMSSIEARENPNIKLLVKPVRFGTTSYRGIIITRQDSGIRTLNDLKGKRFAWVEKESASGYIFPKALLLEAGINPETDFSEVAYLGKHDSVVLNVLLGRYDAGACYDDARTTLRDKSKMDELTILASTPDISNEPIVVRSNLPQDLIEKIRQALLELDINSYPGKEVLETLTDVQGFVPANETDYDYVEQVLKLLEKHQSD